MTFGARHISPAPQIHLPGSRVSPLLPLPLRAFSCGFLSPSGGSFWVSDRFCSLATASGSSSSEAFWPFSLHVLVPLLPHTPGVMEDVCENLTLTSSVCKSHALSHLHPFAQASWPRMCSLCPQLIKSISSFNVQLNYLLPVSPIGMNHILQHFYDTF